MATEEEWRRRFAQQKRSGASISSWCKRQGINANKFFYWRKRLGEAGETEVPGKFIRLDRGEPVEVIVGDNIRIRVPVSFDEALLKRLLGVLGC